MPPIREPLALVGIGCRFPGNADSPTAFWELLRNGEDAITDVPVDRWSLRRFYHPNPDAPGKAYVRQGGFLRGAISSFEPAFFGITPREAAALDPQQRVLLEVTYEAFEDAGLSLDAVRGANIGVYIGAFTMDNLSQQLGVLSREAITTHTAVATTMTMLSNRLSYTFDLRGTSLSLDTACSSSLVAFHLACQAVWNGECEAALAGGVNIMFRPEFVIAMCKGHFLSPDARCKAFDAAANGYVRGEGAGVVLLKPLSQALADGDRIYALVRGTGSNQDGRTAGITLPNEAAQESLVQTVCAAAGIAGGQVAYVEAHGTGTAAGDPIEARSLSAALQAERTTPLWIGSVKTNIGHLEAAAGVAGVIKAALILYHKQIPPHLHFRTANPEIDLDALRLRIPLKVEPLPAVAGESYVGINSFGYGGTNAHAILSNLPQRQRTIPRYRPVCMLFRSPPALARHCTKPPPPMPPI
ncbi:MAG TPA: polyketide synthase [Aggregatilineales bacterium]|nr:polyketide synthase [Aggregatilineales bacterium]